MIATLLGKKIGMTQVYDAQNVLVPVKSVDAAGRPGPSYRRISAMISPYSVSPTGVKPTRSKKACGPPSPPS